MAYSKTNWVNNTTPINETNLNKIEQGIYDNSLVVEAVTNKLNPTDTETYKTAELTEGQITDVIAVSDILIKGQTLQDGEPTPSAPVDVNVVSGSNVINIENENLLDYNAFVKGRINSTTGKIEYENNVSNMKIVRNTISFTTTVAWNSGISSDFILVKQNDYTYSIKNASVKVSVYVDCYDENKNYLSRYGTQTINANEEKNWLISITNTNVKYIRLHYETGLVGTIILTNTMLKQGSTATTYEPHQGKELPLDLPVVNLFDKDNETYTNGYISGSSATTLSNSTYNRTLYIPCKPNTTYAIQKMVPKDSSKFMIASSVDVPATGVNIYNVVDAGTYSTHAIYTTSNNAKYLLVTYMQTNLTSTTVAEMLNSIQIEQGSKVNAYTPFGTEPIELCKIGNYQDYFYKSGSKWYLHKEIGKVVLDGSEGGFSTVDSRGSYYRISLLNVNNIKNFGSQRTTNIFINNFSKSTADNYNSVFQYEDDIYFYLPEGMSTKQAFVDLLSSTNSVLYYVLNNTTNTEVTDTTLISQLEAIYNAPLYEQTNITQTNNDLPMVLDITACKDNINGIKALLSDVNEIKSVVNNNADNLNKLNEGIANAVEKSDLLNLIYPVGSIYMSVNSTSPATLFGGTWEAIGGRFLLGADTTYSAGSTGGEETHRLTIDEMPSHNHTWNWAYAAASGNDTWNSAGVNKTGESSDIIGNTGGGKPHNNMPPYLAVYMWKRTA